MCDREIEVVHAMAGADMHKASALFHGDKVARQNRHVEVIPLSVQRVSANTPSSSEASEFRVQASIPAASFTASASSSARISFSPIWALLFSVIAVTS